MIKLLLKHPKDVRQFLLTRYRNQHRKWLMGQGDWPVSVLLGSPKEDAIIKDQDSTRAWVRAWQSWSGSGKISWRKRRWPIMGIHELPERIVFSNPEEVTEWLGEKNRWRQARVRYQHLVGKWPCLSTSLARYYDILADYSDDDIDRLESILTWLEANPISNLYPRQLPIAGIDTKWLDSRKGLITELLLAIQGNGPDSSRDFFQCCGLKRLPNIIRMRVLDQSLRAQLGGLGDIASSIDDFMQLDLPVSRVYIVENIQTGLAFTDLPDSIVLMGLGYNVDFLIDLSWLESAHCFYWGDIDTHGLAILNRARSYLPNLKSILMDEATLMQYKNLWTTEKEQHSASELPLLSEQEQFLYQSLKQQVWGEKVRLEQERISWEYAWGIITSFNKSRE